MLSLVISLVATVTSVASLLLAYAGGRRDHMPVLQFVWEAGRLPGFPALWCLVNVGTGPATNVVVAQTTRTALRRGTDREEWFNPVVVPSIPAGGRLVLPWLGGTMALACGLGASYTDAGRYFYTTKCGDDMSMFFTGLHIPRWPLLKVGGRKAVKTWWEVPDLSGPNWSRADPGHVRRRWWLPRRYGLSRRLGGWADPVASYRHGDG